METVIIDVSTRFTDNTSPGIDKTREKTDSVTKSVKKARKETERFGKTRAEATLSIKDRAISVIEKANSGIKKIAGKTFSMTMKVVDLATSPLRKIFNFATSLKGIITGIIAGVAAQKAIMEPLNLADMFTSAEIGFETKLGGLKQAQAMMKQIQEFAIKTPFETQDVINTSQRMLAMGWAAKRILPDLEKIGNASAAMGKGSEGIDRITLALSQMRMKGKVSAEEMLQLTEVGINGWGYLAQAFHKSVPEIQNMTKKGLIPVDKAINAIVQGMSEFDGMMDKTSMRTVSGVISQIKDLFDISIVKNWGEGLQSGAIKGLSELNDWLSKNRASFDKFGAQVKVWGGQFSNFVVKTAEDGLKRINDLMNDPEFQRAGFIDKIGIVWDKLIASPLSDWWKGPGGEKVREWGGNAGNAIGEAIGKGIGTGLTKLLPSVINDALTALPGGKEPSGTSWLSMAALLYGGTKVLGGAAALGKGIGGIGKLLGLGGAAAGTGAAGAGLLSAALPWASILSAVGGVAAAGSDLATAARVEQQKAKQDSYWKAGTRAGMVGTGALAGAAIGSVVPGLGTALGALVGAGAGGLGAMFAGGSVGKFFSDVSDGTHEIDHMSDALTSATSEVEKLTDKDQRVRNLADEYAKTTRILNDGKSTVEQRVIAEAARRDIMKQMQEIYPDIISKYDIENGKLGDKLSTIERISDLEKEEARIKLDQAVRKGEEQLPDIEDKYLKNADELRNLQKQEKDYAETVRKMSSIKGDIIEILQEQENAHDRGDYSMDDEYAKRLQHELDLANQIGEKYGQQYVNTVQFVSALDDYSEKLDEIQTAELNSLSTNKELQSKYIGIYDAQKKMIELNLGGTIEDQAAKFDTLGKTAQSAFLQALAQLDEIQRKMNLLPSEKKINIAAVYHETVLKDKSVTEIQREMNMERRMQGLDGYANGTEGAAKGPHLVGERGPEIIDFSGGEKVYDAHKTKRILGSGYADGAGTDGIQTGSKSAVVVQMGGSAPLVSVTVQADSGNPQGVADTIRKQMPGIADELMKLIAQALEQVNGNMPVVGES